MVIFHSHVKLPEGRPLKLTRLETGGSPLPGTTVPFEVNTVRSAGCTDTCSKVFAERTTGKPYFFQAKIMSKPVKTIVSIRFSLNMSISGKTDQTTP